MIGRPVLESKSPGNNTSLCPCLLMPCTAALILPLTTFDLKSLAAVSSLSLVPHSGWYRLSATVSKQRAACLPISNRSRRCVIL